MVFDNFDANKDGNIAYSEFVNVLRVREGDLILCNLSRSRAFLKLTRIETFHFCVCRVT